MNNNNENENKIRRKKVSSSINEQQVNTTKKSSSASSNKNKSRQKNSSKAKKDKFKFIRVTATALLVLLVVGVVGGTGLVFSSLRNVKTVTKSMLDDATYQTTEIRYANNTLLSNAPSENKKDPVSLSQISPYLQKAVISIEDERFYEHQGVDFRGLARAAVKTLTGTKQGASTIPMQVSKMLLTSTEQSIPRKIKDIYYAFEMSKTLSKEQILEVYLNNFFVGKGLAGAEAGARGYFDKDAKDLTLAESALLAGATKYPRKYSAYINDKLSGTETKEDVENKLLFFIKVDGFDAATPIELEMIDKIYAWGLIPSEDTYQQLKKGTMVVRKAVPNAQSMQRRNVVLGKMLEVGAISDTEYTTAIAEPINIKLPKPSEKVSSSVEDLIEYEVIDALMQQGNTRDEAYNMFYNGGLIIDTTIDPDMQNILESEYKNNSNFPGHKIGPNGIAQPQSSMVILDYRNGQIKALVGGRNITGRKGTNRATAPQQPGSTIKPLSVYTPAIDTLKITQSTALSDAEGGYKFRENNNWNPNTTTAGSGTMSLRKALAYSSNTIAIKTAEMLGSDYEDCIDIMMDYLKNFGISTLIDSNTADKGKNDRKFPALTLGGMTVGVSPLEMASAYGTLANGGVYIEPTIFTAITSYDGQIIVKNTPQENRVLSPDVAYVLTDMLNAVVTEGLGKPASLGNMPVAGKTGTTNRSLDAWFVGYTPYYVGATYIGDDAGVQNPETNKFIPRRGVPGGSKTPARLWQKVMSQIHKNLTPTKFKVSDNIYFTRINLIDGGRSSSGSNAAFINGTAPSRYTYQPSTRPKPKPQVKPQEPVAPPVTEGGGETPPPVTPPETGGGGGTTPPPVTPPETGGGDTTPPPPSEDTDGGTTPPPVSPGE